MLNISCSKDGVYVDYLNGEVLGRVCRERRVNMLNISCSKDGVMVTVPVD